MGISALISPTQDKAFFKTVAPDASIFVEM
jgi:hypothetical protein